jgi:hypothetical protein
MRVYGYLLAGLIAAVCAYSQVTSRLTGSVTDPTGAAVPAAIVEVYLSGGAKPLVSMPTTTDGLFAFTGVPPAVYDVVVTAQGFRKHTDRGVVLTASAGPPCRPLSSK